MQIINRFVNRIKSDKQLFQYLANKLYKFFNIIERNDLIKLPRDPKIYRVLDVYDTGAIDYLCDEDPNPMRERLRGNAILHSKFFKLQDQYRSEKHDNGWRLFGGGFYNFNTKEILQRKEKGKTLPCK